MLTETKLSRVDVIRAPWTRGSAAARYQSVRRFSKKLVEPLSAEDCVVQSMPDASPAKWHLAHTTWFFEALALKPYSHDYRIYHEQFNFLYNSYYNALGERHPRPRRGMITRPSLDEVMAYRIHVDQAIDCLIRECSDDQWPELAVVLEIGLNHEQQHQELLLTDIKHLLWSNPLRPAYRDESIAAHSDEAASLNWTHFDEGVYEIGHAGDSFAYDNEGPRHRAFLEPFSIASRLVTNGEFLEFVEDGGYEKPEYWLDEGWATVNALNWRAPLYWYRESAKWRQFTLRGCRTIDPAEPVCHLSLFEADAYARYRGHRLPTEEEWEVAAADAPIAGNFVESGRLHPGPHPASAHTSSSTIGQLYGDLWEWTRSQYEPYPGYRPPEGAIGEYNGKFMCNQFVLRGGSCATSETHIRRTYRNFFQPAARWQFSGLRLAKDT